MTTLSTLYSELTLLTNFFPAEALTRLPSVGRAPIGLTYVVRQKYKDEYTRFGGIGNILLFTADVSGALLFSLAITGCAISRLAQVSVSFLYVSAYAPIGLNSIIVLGSLHTSFTEKGQALLDLANSVSQIALTVALYSAASTPVVISLVAATILFGSTSFLYRVMT